MRTTSAPREPAPWERLRKTPRENAATSNSINYKTNFNFSEKNKPREKHPLMPRTIRPLKYRVNEKNRRY
jgi:hypothetical protein